MPLIDVAEMPERLVGGQTIAGLDLGTKTIGTAVSDLGWGLATPRRTIRRTSFSADAAALIAMIRDERCGALVVGLPLNMDGSQGPRAQSSRAFVRNLLQRIDLPMVLWDERLSTVAAERQMVAADVSRRKRAERIDSAAAAYILQGALDRISSLIDPER